MTTDDLYAKLEKRPFEPFRIQVSDGIFYGVRHPELVMVGLGAIIVGVPAAGKKKPVYERVETISLGHVVKLLPVDGQEAGTKA